MTTAEIIAAENERNAWPCLLLVYDCYPDHGLDLEGITLGYWVYVQIPKPLDMMMSFYRSA